MLHLLDEALESFLRSEVPLSSRQVAVVFEAPDEEWASKVTRPTVNMYLWDVRSNLVERHAGTELVEDGDGKRYRRPPMPRVDCRYLVTAWTTALKDEHQLLGAVLSALLDSRELAEEHLPEAYSNVRPLPTIAVANPDGGDHSDFWTALGGRLKPGLDLVVTATVDVGAKKEAGPPVEGFDMTVGDKDLPSRSSRTTAVGGRANDAKGRRVHTSKGSTTVAADGSFLVRGDREDEVSIEGQPQSDRKKRSDSAKRSKRS
jgi:Pvc16 N-terminal domain